MLMVRKHSGALTTEYKFILMSDTALYRIPLCLHLHVVTKLLKASGTKKKREKIAGRSFGFTDNISAVNTERGCGKEKEWTGGFHEPLLPSLWQTLGEHTQPTTPLRDTFLVLVSAWNCRNSSDAFSPSPLKGQRGQGQLRFTPCPHDRRDRRTGLPSVLHWDISKAVWGWAETLHLTHPIILKSTTRDRDPSCSLSRKIN